MSNVPRQALREIIAKYGTEICSDSRRCEGLLKDKCGSYRREISILINALDERVPLDLLAGNAAPRELLLTRLAKRLEDNLALTEDAAVWAVESWALALDIITDREAAERVNQRINNRKQDLDFGSENRTGKTENQNFPSVNNKPQKQPAPQPPPKNNQPPVFAPPNSIPQIDISIGTQSAPIPTHPAPAGKTPPQSNQPQTPATPARPKKRSWKARGCFVGCFLLLVLLGVLIVGVPYAFKVMRETQQSSEPPRFPPQ